MNQKILNTLRPQSLVKYIARHPDQFEKVENTGYSDKKNREVIAQYVYKGQEHTEICRDCGGFLKPKTMKVAVKNGAAHITNGLEKPVEMGDGRVIVIWVCSRKCLACDAHQRVFPAGVAGWVRYALVVVWELLTHLFEDRELRRPGPLTGKSRRPWDTLPFCGENATLYRWRAQVSGGLDQP